MTLAAPSSEGCNEYLNLTLPEVISDIHQTYLEAGADILETNTFGAASVVLAEYNLAHEARRINREAAQLARRAADGAATPERPRFVAGAIGPTTKTISLTGGITFDLLADAYQEQALGLIEGGVDLLLMETTQDTINLKAGLIAFDRAFAELGRKIPIAVQGTVEPMGTLLAGQDAEAFYTSLSPSGFALDWLQLRYRSGVYDRPYPHALRSVPISGCLRAQCRAARRRREV